jgi:hypothetical protein
VLLPLELASSRASFFIFVRESFKKEKEKGEGGGFNMVSDRVVVINYYYYFFHNSPAILKKEENYPINVKQGRVGLNPI